jgi:nicotinate-nucleotide--dimethylbenzimidazole phosphoribosyltransferase
MSNLVDILKNIEPLDKESMRTASMRQDQLTKPQGSLGALEQIAIQIAGIQRQPLPKIRNKAIITMAADHGVAARGVSLYPPEVTSQMLLNFVHGGAAINVLARMINARVVTVDMGVSGNLPKTDGIISKMIDSGTRDISRGPAMTREQAMDCLLAGISILENELNPGLDIFGTGEMGIGNTTSAAAITAVITGKPIALVTGRGTGIGDEQLSHKISIIEQSLSINKPNPSDPVDILSKVGGFEIGGLAGAILAGAANRIPIIIDGFISGAAALLAVKICPQVKDYLIASHLSAEKGHAACLEYLQLTPSLNLNMRLGEGTGAALGIFLAEAAVNLLSDMATFSEASVSNIYYD